MMTLIADVLYLSAALAIFATVVLFVLSPMYAFWIENKYGIDVESDLYAQIAEAVEKAGEEGQEISVKITIGEPDIEEAAKEA
tara:strand:- start:532 stop:780 length:249 start_codon:yes stop_codon:yes gene_type:complete